MNKTQIDSGFYFYKEMVAVFRFLNYILISLLKSDIFI